MSQPENTDKRRRRLDRLNRNAKRRRDALRAVGYCQNGLAHGRATRGRRCQHCHEVHKYRGAVVTPLAKVPGLPRFIPVGEIARWAAILDDRREEAMSMGDLTAQRKIGIDPMEAA